MSQQRRTLDSQTLMFIEADMFHKIKLAMVSLTIEATNEQITALVQQTMRRELAAMGYSV